MAANTQPLTLGEILDRTVQIYRRNFPLFLGISILPAAIYVAVYGSFSLYYTSKLPAIEQVGRTPGPASPPAMLAFFLATIVFFLVGIPVLMGVSAASLGALNFAAVWSNRGEPATIRGAYARSFRHFWRYLGIVFLQILFAGILPGAAAVVLIVLGGVVTALGAGSGGGPVLAVLLGLFLFLLVVALVGVCIWIWIRFCLAFPASGVEGMKAWPSLKRSSQLSKGTRGRIFVMYLLVVIMTMVVYYALTLPVDIVLKLTLYKSMAALALITNPPIVLQVVNLVISCLERAFALPIYSIALVLFYIDQRTRVEGYDIEQLMDRAGWTSSASAAPPPPPVGFPQTSSPTPPSFGEPEPPFEGSAIDPASANSEGSSA